MKKCSLQYIIWLAVAILFLLSGCATPPKKEFAEEPIKPNVRIRPVIELLKVKTAKEKVSIAFDAVGRANVIIASSKLKEVRHIVVESEGVKEREVIRSNISPGAIDSAFDEEGHLHVLIDDEHMIKKEGTWQVADRTPWKELGVKIKNPRFVHGAQGLIWAFEVGGKELGTPWRLDWYGFGGYGAGIIWPWPTRARKLVVVPEMQPTYTSWTVVDPNEKGSTEEYHLSADTRGNVLIVYASVRAIIVRAAQPRYVRFRATVRTPDATTDSETVTSFKESRLLHKVTGKDFYGGTLQSDLAMDPETGSAILLQGHQASWLFHDNSWSEPIRFPLKTFWEPRLVPAGGDCYHAAVIGNVRGTLLGNTEHVIYVAFTHGMWSSPVDLGEADVSGFVGNWDAVQIGSDGKSNALVVWPVKEGIVARWITLVR